MLSALTVSELSVNSSITLGDSDLAQILSSKQPLLTSESSLALSALTVSELSVSGSVTLGNSDLSQILSSKQNQITVSTDVTNRWVAFVLSNQSRARAEQRGHHRPKWRIPFDRERRG